MCQLQIGEFGITFVTILRSIKTEFRGESNDCLKIERMHILLCDNINYKPTFDLDVD